MERSCFTATFRTALVLLLCLPLWPAHANTEQYFSPDLDDAVSAARSNPVNTNFVGARWYNRTTSRSFSLPKMLNTEMDEEVIEGAMGPTAAGEAAAVAAQQPAVDSALGRQSKNAALADTSSEKLKRDSDSSPESAEKVDGKKELFIPEARSEFAVSRNIRASGVSVKATPKP
ncbi:hypothetical protein GJQ55_02575 [Venatoribacter cucullus]|uniref:Secreted protein n=1 Tax=Venatoribacter cucullus TaxID=2661630 RepID=A0A9X7V0L6_9GAMM|nr:hypothetical protein [Venatoribacter cucullus]QQD20727.1 hypothetical protein GJQ54_02610 [Oceanospirillaceae bacterium ASx5O]QQD23434.1 hypothetical protein GJQ55_02575 [Venatoribacter cucullus]